MKINFDASYGAVARLIDSQVVYSRPRTKQSGFEEALQKQTTDAAASPAVTGDSRSLVDPTKEATPIAQGYQMPDDIRARYAFPISDEPATESLNQRLAPPEPTSSAGTNSKVPELPEIVGAQRIKDSNRLSEQQVSQLIRNPASRHGVDPSLGMAIISAESGFNPTAVSSDGFNSKGLFQLLDRTGQDEMRRLKLETAYEPFSPELNINLGLSYLRKLHDHFSSKTNLGTSITTTPVANSTTLEKFAVAAFNAGEGRVAAAQMHAKATGQDPSSYDAIEQYLPETTQEYVRRVMRERVRFAGPPIG